MSVKPSLPDFDALWDYGQPRATEQAFRNLLDLVDPLDPLSVAGEPDRVAYLFELLTQIARAQGLQGRFEEAHRTLDEVESALANAQPRVHLRYLLERGRVWNSSGSIEQSVPLFTEAWELASAAGEDALAVDAAHMVAIVAPAQEKLVWNLRALDLARRSTDAKAQKWIGSLLNNIGWTYHDAGRYEDALDTLQRALAWQEQEGTTRQIEIARWCVGRTLRSLRRVEEALALQRSLLSDLDARGEADGYVHEELAECLLAVGRGEEARPHFAAAHAELSHDSWLVAHEAERLRRLGMMAEGEFSA
jgi:tetratricopeptide (TPR) repeat protein